jgi:hypothetical protein
MKRHELESSRRSRLRDHRDTWRQVTGGANRDRTDDLRVANATLSQLSYGPSLNNRILENATWWVWEELHPRPHPYQGCALTN